MKVFSCINSENLTRLAYMFMLRKEEPWVIAVVASRLEPELGRELLLSLPDEIQTKVALMGLTIRQVTKGQLAELDERIKENVNFIVEGMERLGGELLRADFETRYNIINYLKNKKPLVYRELREHYLVFEDLMAVSSRDMQTIVRNLTTELMAKALQNVPPGLLHYFYSSMSTGAASLLKESMCYCENSPQLEIDKARFRAMEVIHRLEVAGEIAPRSELVRRVI